MCPILKFKSYIMKKLALVITLLITLGVSAQERKEKRKDITPEKRVEKRTERITEKLGLDETQKKKVKEIFEAQQKENMATKEALKTEREKLRAKMKEKMTKQHEELKAKLKTVLTDEQFKKWEAIQNENIEKFKDKRKEKRE